MPNEAAKLKPNAAVGGQVDPLAAPTLKPTCPACGHTMTDDEMLEHEDDLFAIAPNEENADIECPGCETPYVCKGGYRPNYTSAIDPDDSW